MSRPIHKAEKEYGEVLTLFECADMLHYSENTLRKMLNEEIYDIPVHYIGAQPRFIKQEVLDWLKSRSNLPKERIWKR